jgi:hypothetical protein
VLNVSHLSKMMWRLFVCVRATHLGIAKARPAEKDDVGAPPDGSVRLENGLVHVLKRVVSSTTPTSPLQHDDNVGMLVGDSNRVVDRVNRPGLECDVTEPRSSHLVHELGGLLRCWDTSSDSDRLERRARLGHLLDQRPLR